ncbi:Wadjet anti-phage system protein JetD domain-containing protein [Dyella acidisoli]|uniref:DUF3322 and DUF2220 domain-containing protein n=1 Tax=Dyella acidisoli TaxID=1867834 RepID=A0ABQ5XTM3_9GAMM|nr:DUF3322 and DUF2220 domain-containing protein [Dyella acidisoli]GLQ95231.1 hypothetical protein GCM10007901_41860 [Dyella acidisoli]
MRAPEELRRRLQARWQNQRRHWLLGEGEWPLSLSMEPPTEAKVLADWTRFDAWLVQWRDVSSGGPGIVRFEVRTWSRVGEQSIPCAWQFATPDAVAAELGEAARWSQARQRFDTLSAWKVDAAWHAELARHFDLLADLDDAEFQRLCSVVEWLRQHPASGFFPRQLPVPGIDSKWIESRRAIVAAWVGTLQGLETQGDFYAITGLRAAPDRLRMRLLDPTLRAACGGLSDIEAPASEFIALNLPVRQVLIVENLVTGLACEELSGTLVFMHRGYAVEALAALPWLAQLPVYYWGDIDTHGLAILSRLRGYLPQTRSLMMDEETLLAFKSLWGREDKPHPAMELSHLSEVEQRLYRGLREGEYKQVRLEQERIAWDWAWQRVLHSLSPQGRGLG